MTIKIEDFAFGNQQPKNPNEKPNLNQFQTLSDDQLSSIRGGARGSIIDGGELRSQQAFMHPRRRCGAGTSGDIAFAGTVGENGI